jgi:hypothetical protein
VSESAGPARAAGNPSPSRRDGRAAPEAAVPPADRPEEVERGPQWGEAYLLFDGHFLSLDDLLRAPGD